VDQNCWTDKSSDTLHTLHALAERPLRLLQDDSESMYMFELLLHLLSCQKDYRVLCCFKNRNNNSKNNSSNSSNSNNSSNYMIFIKKTKKKQKENKD